MTATLSVSLVVYHQDLPVLRDTLASLRVALERRGTVVEKRNGMLTG